MALPVTFGALRGLAKELEVSGRDEKPLAVGGARELASVLRRELGRDAKPGAVSVTDDPRGAAVYVYVLAHEPREEDEQALKRARRARVPIVAVASGPVAEMVIPYVLATDVVPVEPGAGFPVDAIARVIAARLGEEAAPLAARLPVLRRAVADALVASFAWKTGVRAALIFVPGADLPILALNQIRMILRIEQAYGLDPDPRQRAPELLASLAASLGLRAAARELLATVPVAGWAVKGAVAYAGTRALGEAAIRRVESGLFVPGGAGMGVEPASMPAPPGVSDLGSSAPGPPGRH
jgi:uncharacterized protein (DUF697 family)